MNLLYFFLISFVVMVVVVPLIWRSDRRWYKRHPGVEGRLDKIDEELCRKEGR